MSVFTAHRILIATATVFFAFYGVREIVDYGHDGGTPALAQAIVSFLVAFGLGLYWRTIPRD
jgi:hypothetical protein